MPHTHSNQNRRWCVHPRRFQAFRCVRCAPRLFSTDVASFVALVYVAAKLATYVGSAVFGDCLRLMEGLEADTGAGIVAGGAVSLSGHVQFRNCTAKLSGSAIIAQGPIDAEAAVIEAEGHTDPPTVTIYSGNGSIGIGRLDCLKSPGCKVQGRSPDVASLQCPVGEGFHKAAATVSCRRCQVKHTRLSADAEACTPCPNMPTLGCKQRYHIPQPNVPPFGSSEAAYASRGDSSRSQHR